MGKAVWGTEVETNSISEMNYGRRLCTDLVQRVFDPTFRERNKEKTSQRRVVDGGKGPKEGKR